MEYVTWIRQRVGSTRIFLNFAAAAILDADNRVLLQHRADTGTWGFPGGAMELGESAEQTMLREVHEETGLTVTSTGLLGIYTNYTQTYPNGDSCQIIAVHFTCRITAGELSTRDPETLALEWIDPADPPSAIHMVNNHHADALSDLAASHRNVTR